MPLTVSTRSRTRKPSSSESSNSNAITTAASLEETSAKCGINDITKKNHSMHPRQHSHSRDSRDNSAVSIDNHCQHSNRGEHQHESRRDSNYSCHHQESNAEQSTLEKKYFPINLKAAPMTTKKLESPCIRSYTANGTANSTSSVNCAFNRPESRCSQHSNTSCTSSSLSTRRTTTSRRGGRASRSRSPLVFSGLANKRHTPCRGYGMTASRSAIAQPLTVTDVEQHKGTMKSIDKTSQPESRKRNDEIEKEFIPNTKTTDAVSSVAAKAAAEAQRLCMNARDNEGLGNSRNDRRGRPRLLPIEMERISGERQDHHQQSRQNVFRQKPNMTSDIYSVESGQYRSTSRITTRSSSKIKKPSIGNGGTSLVMGTATPMHVPRASPDPNLLPKQKETNELMSPTSELRFEDLAAPPGSPQRLLLDLKSGSRSFELRSPMPEGSPSKLGHIPPLSPQEPPQIQNSHVDSHSFFFEPQKSPRTPRTPKTPRSPSHLLGTPSFKFFDQDFDSFDDNDNFHLPTPNPNSNSLLSEENDLRSPMLSLVRSIEGPSPRKPFSHSPLFDAFESTFCPTPRKQPKDRYNVDKITDSMIEGAPPMPQVSTSEKESTEKDDKVAIPECKSTPSQRPPKKRILEQEKRSPAKPLSVLSDIDNAPQRLIEASPQNMKIQEKSPRKIKPEPHIQHPYRPSQSPNVQRLPYPYHHPKYMMCKTPKKTIPSLSGMTLAYFYKRLASHNEALSGFSFLLPSLKNIVVNLGNASELTNLSKSKSIPSEQNAQDIALEGFPQNARRNLKQPSKNMLAERRVKSAVCAFGGSCEGSLENKLSSDSMKNSIFRMKIDPDQDEQLKYVRTLPGRYYENENRISWEIEDDSPVVLEKYSINEDTESMKRKSASPEMDDKTTLKRSKIGDFGDLPNSSSSCSASDQPKMRYRCKLCGQPKQNHTCPYQQSLQRNIGISVYPAVNSFSAIEPGYLAPALSEMNNFINGNEIYAGENPHSYPSPEKTITTTPLTVPTPIASQNGNPHQITPDTDRYNATVRAPEPPLSSPSPKRVDPPPAYIKPNRYRQYPMHMTRRLMPVIIRRKTILSHQRSSVMSRESHRDILFMEKGDLRPEQYRIVSAKTSLSNGFKYPPLPLPYKQRKVLSDNLFALSKEVPKLTDECASVLRQAREQDKWDLAVAELLTQIIVVIYCPEEDSVLDGLSKYLLTLGFAC